MKKIKVISIGCLLLVLTTKSFADLSTVFAQIAQAYNVDAQQQSYQNELRDKAKIEKERAEIERRFAQADAAQTFQDGHTAMLAHDDSDYRALPSSCMKEGATTEFMCYAGNDNYYKVTKLPDGYSWTGFNTPKSMNWVGQMTKQGKHTVYSGTDASGKVFKKTCSASACFE